MPISKCPLCDGQFEIQPEWIGQTAACPYCKRNITIGVPVVQMPKPRAAHTLSAQQQMPYSQPIPQQAPAQDLQVYCPRCKCTQISTIEEEHTDPLRCLFWGIFALGFKNRVLYNVCKKCGHKWELKQSLSKEEIKKQNSTNATIFLVGIVIIIIIFIVVYKAYS